MLLAGDIPHYPDSMLIVCLKRLYGVMTLKEGDVSYDCV